MIRSESRRRQSTGANPASGIRQVDSDTTRATPQTSHPKYPVFQFHLIATMLYIIQSM